MTPKEYGSLMKGYKLKKQVDDEAMYIQGLYIYKAVQVVMANFGSGLAGKKGKEEYLKKPFLAMSNNNALYKTKGNANRDRAVWDMWAQSCANSGLPPSPYK